ncbi:unnamed protein product [Peronospora effusa]|uniref:Uncharacterized protein n=1 Tax=Peronospora effusa TaxID=542832 RepID=A0A3R7Z355_9STRA|nr:hypothetical protein DD237_007530 [Peronospora effusa]CAI5720148.1 unnamed protein product [Peronospora effusa]
MAHTRHRSPSDLAGEVSVGTEEANAVALDADEVAKGDKCLVLRGGLWLPINDMENVVEAKSLKIHDAGIKNLALSSVATRERCTSRGATARSLSAEADRACVSAM